MDSKGIAVTRPSIDNPSEAKPKYRAKEAASVAVDPFLVGFEVGSRAGQVTFNGLTRQ